MIIRDLQHAQEVLKLYIPDVAGYAGDGMSLDRMWPLLKVVGDPHDKLKIVHVAGTSGKTSTCYYISEILTRAGQKTGLTVSPHVDSITERVQINGAPIPDDEFCFLMGEFLEFVENSPQRPSYFELMVVFVYWVFAKKKVDYAVVETGMGGLLDGSNVAKLSDKVCVITDIGLDHTHILGNSVEEISVQKAGIVHPGNIVFINRQDSKIINEFKLKAEEVGSDIRILDPIAVTNEKSAKESIPLFQYRNWHLASRVCEYVADRDGFILDGPVSASDVAVPGRMQEMLIGGREVVMDGAHNAQKTEALVESYSAMFPGQKATVLIALKKGKEYREVMKNLAPITSSLIVTAFSTSQDLPAISQDPYVIRDHALSMGIESIAEIDHAKAFNKLMATEGKRLVVGSFYLLGQIRHVDN